MTPATTTVGVVSSSGAGIPGPTPTPEAKKFFVDKVYPSLIQDCGSCNADGQVGAPIYLAGGADASYDFMHEYNNGALVAVPEKNLLLLKDRHEGPDIGGTTRTNVQQWLALEYPTYTPKSPPKTVFQALVNFGQCLSKQAFLVNGLAQLFNTPTDVVAGQVCTCATCHNQADAAVFGGGLIIDQDPDVTFEAFQDFPGMMIFAQGLVSETASFAGLVESRRIELKGQEPSVFGPNQTACLCDPNNRLDPALNFNLYCHPTYALDQALIDQIDAFAQTAISRETTLQCNADNTK